ncbi:MAG TPA: universal stress protein [Candidatus Dormibacteraeota bacterium]|jgi:nucleotide-binding universal stress UspA family protein|nr:universal stress protein [Candidatus Dormibacteraeota bacterium]
MTQPRSIVLAADGSEKAMVATRVAASLAAAWHTPLHLVHTWTQVPPAMAAYGGFGGGMAVVDTTLIDLRGAATEVVAGARAVAEKAGCTVVEHLVEDPRPADAILDIADRVDAELIVAGRRGLGALGRLFVGSVSEELLHRTTRPVLLVHGEAGCWPPQTVIAAVDGSDEASRAALLGASIAAATGAGVELLQAVRRDADDLVDLEPDAYRTTVVNLTARLHERAERVATRSGAKPVRARLELAEPVRAIMAAVGGVPAPVLVAMGTHGRGRAHRLVLGSVATSVVHQGVTSVLVVPPPTRPLH